MPREIRHSVRSSVGPRCTVQRLVGGVSDDAVRAGGVRRAGVPERRDDLERANKDYRLSFHLLNLEREPHDDGAQLYHRTVAQRDRTE